MSEVLVGSAYSVMELRYQQFSQGVSIVEQQIQKLQQLTKSPIVVQAQLAGAGAGSGTLAPPSSRVPSNAPSVDADAAAYTRLQRSQAVLEAQQARIARGAGDTTRAAQLEAQAIARLTSELNAQVGVSVQSIAIERQLASVHQQTAQTAQQAARQAAQAAQQQRAEMDKLRDALKRPQVTPAAGGSVLGDLQKTAGLVGVGLGVQQLVSFGEGALRAANSLDRTEATVRALSGSQARYNEVLAVAQAGQQAYGGSLEENLRGLGTLVNLSNRAGVSLGALDNISRRLAIVDPVQGIEGANIALKEFLAGDNAEAALSLARRFELPKTALANLAREGVSAKDRLAGLNALLNEQGITTQVLTDRTKTQAAIYDRLGASALNARDAIGALIATQGAGAAGSATGALTGATQLISFYTELENKNKDVFNALQGILNPIQTYNNAVLGAGASVLQWAGSLTTATNAAQTQTDIESLRAERIATSTAATVTQIDIEDRRVQQLNANAAAASVAAREQTEAINQSAQASVLDAAAKDAQQNVTALLAAQTKQSVDGFFALNPQIDQSGVLALLAAGKINAQERQLSHLRLQSDEAAGALGRLNLAQGIAAGAATLVPESRRIGGTGNTVGGIAGSIGGGAGALSARVDAEQQALQASRDALALSRATNAAQRIAIYQRQLDRQTTEEGRNRILAQIEGEKRGGAGRVGAAANTALQLNQVEENSGLQLLKTQRENLERLRDQAEDFDVRRSRAQEDFAEKRRSLLARGQRAQASALSRDFEKDQRREQEDFDRQKRRTLRNNQEATGDIGARTDLRQQQIGDRAALRGTPVSGQRVPDLGQAPPSLTGTALSGAAIQPRVIQIVLDARVDMDGKQVGQLVYVAGLREQIDQDLALVIAGISAPGSGQPAVAGVG